MQSHERNAPQVYYITRFTTLANTESYSQGSFATQVELCLLMSLIAL